MSKCNCAPNDRGVIQHNSWAHCPTCGGTKDEPQQVWTKVSPGLSMQTTCTNDIHSTDRGEG